MTIQDWGVGGVIQWKSKPLLLCSKCSCSIGWADLEGQQSKAQARSSLWNSRHKACQRSRAGEKGDKPKPAELNSRNFTNYCECSMSLCGTQCTGAQSPNGRHNQQCSNISLQTALAMGLSVFAYLLWVVPSSWTLIPRTQSSGLLRQSAAPVCRSIDGNMQDELSL